MFLWEISAIFRGFAENITYFEETARDWWILENAREKNILEMILLF